MDLALSDDQRMLRDSVDRLIADSYGFDQRTAYAAEPCGYSREIWAAFVELGLTMLPFAEERGGLGLGGVETMLVGEAFGRGLVIEPYLASVVMAGTALAAGRASARSDGWLQDIMAGTLIAAFADTAAVVLERTPDGCRVTGTARLVLGGDAAGLFLIPAGPELVAIPADAVGLSRRCYRLHGGGGAANIVLDHVAIDAAAVIADGAAAATRAIEAGIAFVAAEALGAMQAALDLTVDYLRTREQFGKPIGANQALQHRAAEMLVEAEQARSAAILAALLQTEPDPLERARGYAAVKTVTGKAARFVGQNAVQLHGGIGVSEEHAISHYFRRLTAIAMLLGDTEQHVARLAELGGFTTTIREE